MITARIEDYLEELFLLEGTGCTITVTDLADRLKITKGTVTATVQKLVDLDMVEHERYGALHLTEDGRRKGMVVFRRHEGFRSFFHEMLGLDREKSSEMACSMEHYVDNVTEERLYALLEFFRRAKADHEPWVDEAFTAIEKPITLPQPLTLTEPGTSGTVLRITANDTIRRKLADIGITTGIQLTLMSVSDGTYTIKIKRSTLVLPLNEAATIWLQPK